MSLEIVRLVRDLLNQDPARMGGHRTIVSYLMDLLFFGELEIIEQVASIEGIDHGNLISYKGPHSPRHGGLLLTAPLALPPPVDFRLWTETGGDPYAPFVRDGRLYAAGANSGRVDLVCKIVAASRVPRRSLRRSVVLAGTFGEESGAAGTGYMLESGQINPEFVCTGAPTNLEIVRAHRGYVIFRFRLLPRERVWRAPNSARTGLRATVTGRPAASFAPNVGLNAFSTARALIRDLRAAGPISIYNLQAGQTVGRVPDRCQFDFLSPRPVVPRDIPAVRFEELPEDVAMSLPQEDMLAVWDEFWPLVRRCFEDMPRPPCDEFEPKGALFNLGCVTTEPDGINFLVDYRPLPGEDVFGLYRRVHLAAERVSGYHPDVLIEVAVDVNQPPMDITADSLLHQEARRVLQSLALPCVSSTMPMFSDGAVFASCELDTLVFGPGWWGAMAQVSNESCLVSHLEHAVNFYQRLIERLCVAV